MDYVFLSQDFFNDYPNNNYPQIECKQNRPYIHVIFTISNITVCLPLRSNIVHPHAYFTDRKNKCGVDYSKAIIIINQKYINKNINIRIRSNEFKKLIGKEYIIKKQFLKYVELYLDCKRNINTPHKDDILNFSTLQYFENYLSILLKDKQ